MRKLRFYSTYNKNLFRIFLKLVQNFEILVTEIYQNLFYLFSTTLRKLYFLQILRLKVGEVVKVNTFKVKWLRKLKLLK